MASISKSPKSARKSEMKEDVWKTNPSITLPSCTYIIIEKAPIEMIIVTPKKIRSIAQKRRTSVARPIWARGRR